ncbi:MAG: hypothetical protein Greene041619_731 [Candidatus Peregrinibacteria bacterium Greene0416_19]|nr:MAG: hypothetical protein Greene041619_731 [Candidatus Peregrinibacteria bacterium Greene0416_19]
MKQSPDRPPAPSATPDHLRRALGPECRGLNPVLQLLVEQYRLRTFDDLLAEIPKHGNEVGNFQMEAMDKARARQLFGPAPGPDIPEGGFHVIVVREAMDDATERLERYRDEQASHASVDPEEGRQDAATDQPSSPRH